MEILPNELLERILIEVIITEVKDLKLVKRVWQQKADRSIHKLSSVCTRWNHIVEADFFLSEVYRILDGTAPDTIRLEVLSRAVVHSFVHKLSTLRDDIYLLNNTSGGYDVTITVYNRNNMAAVADITMPQRCPVDMSACHVSNCVYLLDDNMQGAYSIVRIVKGNGPTFNVLPLVMNLSLRASSMCVSARGDLMILSIEEEKNCGMVHVYSANGILKQKILSPTIPQLSFGDVFMEVRSGNLVVLTASDDFKKQVNEFDTNRRMINQYTSSASALSSAAVADSYGRFLISDTRIKIILLDAEMNVANFIRQAGEALGKFSFVHYCSESNELIGVCAGQFYSSHLTVFRFREI